MLICYDETCRGNRPCETCDRQQVAIVSKGLVGMMFSTPDEHRMRSMLFWRNYNAARATLRGYQDQAIEELTAEMQAQEAQAQAEKDAQTEAAELAKLEAEADEAEKAKPPVEVPVEATPEGVLAQAFPKGVPTTPIPNVPLLPAEVRAIAAILPEEATTNGAVPKAIKKTKKSDEPEKVP